MILCVQRDFAGVIKLRSLLWRDYPGLSRWALCKHTCPYKREVGGGERDGDLTTEVDVKTGEREQEA